MAVYVDDWRQPAKIGRLSARWSHLVGSNEQELHALAVRIGLRRAWFQTESHPHYDVSDTKRNAAIKAGAIPISWRDLPQLRQDGLIL